MDNDYYLIFEDIEGNPIPNGQVIKLDPSWDSEIYEFIKETGVPCDEEGYEFEY